MSEEAGTTSTTAAATPAAAPAAPAAPAEGASQGTMVVPADTTRIVSTDEPLHEKQDVVDTREALFDDEKDLSEEELSGDASLAQETGPAPGEKAPATPPPEGAQPAKETKAPEEPAKPAAAPEKPPEGFVPLAALQEERTKRQGLAQELSSAHRRINELTVAVTTGKAQAPAEDPLAPFKDFKVLTRDEYNTLAEDDIVGAQKYLGELSDYREAQRKADDLKRQNESQDRAQRDNFVAIVTTNRAAMEREVPGLYDDKSDINGKLQQFAESHGMDGNLLAELTDPATIITINGKPQYLGHGAVAVLRMVNSMFTAEKATEERIRQQVTQEFVDKFKIDAGTAFRSIGDSPAARTVPEDTGQVFTEDQVRNWTPDEEKKYLGGS